MSQDPSTNPVTGQPFGGRDAPNGSMPGERPLRGDEADVQPPKSSHKDDETASRAATEGVMAGGESDGPEPTEGVADYMEAPPADSNVEGDPPGGSVANQQGRTPDH